MKPVLWGQDGLAVKARLFCGFIALLGCLLAISGCTKQKIAQGDFEERKKNALALQNSPFTSVAAASPLPVPLPVLANERTSQVSIHLDNLSILPGATVTGSLSGRWPAGARLVWIDGAGRVADCYNLPELPPTDKTRPAQPQKFSLPVPRGCWGERHELALIEPASKASIRRQSRLPLAPEIENAFCSVISSVSFITPAAATDAWNDYLAILDGGIQNSDPLFWQLIREQGITTIAARTWESGTPGAQNGFSIISDLMPQNKHPLLLQNAHERLMNYAATRDINAFVRQPPIFDDATLETVRDTMERSLTNKENVRPIAWSLGDKLALTPGAMPFDYDLSPVTLDVFRGWLEQKYGTLQALNNQWGAEFSKWSEVSPPVTDEIKAAHNPHYAMGLELLQKKGADAPAQKMDYRSGVRGFTLHQNELRVPGRENFSAWSDAREFNNFAFARLVREYSRTARELGASAPLGLSGGQSPSAWGWDWAQLAPSLGWVEPDDAFPSREMLRSLSPEIRTLARLSPLEPKASWQLWQRWLRGDRGCIISQKESWLPGPLNVHSSDADAVLADIRMLSQGLTTLREIALRPDYGVALYYSPRSIQLHWMLDSEADGSWWMLRDPQHEAARSSALLQYSAWTALLGDLSYSPRFVEPAQLLAGQLNPSQTRVLILPKVLSLSDEEAAAIRAFAKQGGVVISDGACGTFDAHGKRRVPPDALTLPSPGQRRDNMAGAGILDSDFGIARGDLRVLELNGSFNGDESSRVKFHPVDGQEAGPDSPELRVLEPGIVAAGADSHATSATGADALLSKASGKGRFIYLNLCLQDYTQLRTMPALNFQFHGMSAEEYEKQFGTPAGGEAVRLLLTDILTEVFASGEVLSVSSKDGAPLRNIRRTRFALGGSNDFFGVLAESAAPFQTIQLGMDQARHWYDMRTGAYLGSGQSVAAKLPQGRAGLYSALGYQIERLSLKVRRTGERTFKISSGLQTSENERPARHIFHLEVFNPNGDPLPHYGRNIVAEGGTWNGEIILGLNEPAGIYRIVLRDILSGRRTDGELHKENVDCLIVAP